MNKKWVFIIIGILLFVGIIGAVGIGGKVFMDKKQAEKEQRQEAEKVEVERMSVVALKNKYENIKSVEFEKNGYNEMTGSYSLFIEMTDQKNESVSFRFTYWKEREEIGTIGVEDKDVQVKGVTKNKVHVIFSNQEEGEI